MVDDFATRVRLANGSEIVSLPASQRQVRGYGARDVPSLDLSALKNEVQRALERGIRPPLPQSLYGGENADPAIRSAA